MWGMRNRIAHGYVLVDRGMVQQTVENDLPGIIAVIRAELDQRLSDPIRRRVASTQLADRDHLPERSDNSAVVDRTPSGAPRLIG